MVDHQIVSHGDWIAARKKHLAKEKEFMRLRDQLTQQRQQLPWERIESFSISCSALHGFDDHDIFGRTR